MSNLSTVKSKQLFDSIDTMISDHPFRDGILSVLKTKPLIDVAEWAEMYRVLTSSGSAEMGGWTNARTPYGIEIMQALSPKSDIREIVVMKGIQLGFTEFAINFLFFTIHLRPGPFLYLMPTEDLVTDLSKSRITPAIDQMDIIKEKLMKHKTLTVMKKQYDGGYVSFKGANSPTGLRSTPYRYIVCDEVDAFPIDVGKEGDPLAIVQNRSATFSDSKFYCLSTPTLKETSLIWRLYQDSDQRIYMVPCPYCKQELEIKFEYLKWEKGNPHSVYLKCPHCSGQIKEYQKTQMLANGRWVKQNPESEVAGFHISTLYSPVGWYSWQRIISEFEKAERSPELKKAFINTKLGLPYEDVVESVDNVYLERRAEVYPAEVPNEVLMLTMSVDVQKNRLEYEVRGWGKDEESWGIKYGQIEGLTTELTSPDDDFPTVWGKLDEVRQRTFTRADGKTMTIACCMIDSGGIDTTTDTVYKYCLKRERMRVYALKGSNQQKSPIYNKPKRRPGGGCWLFIVGTFEAKRLIYTRLCIEERGAGYYHFPKDEKAGYDTAAYVSMTAERLVPEYKNGYKTLKWWKPQNARNELLDLNVYNLLAVRHMNPDWNALDIRYNQTQEIVTPPSQKKPTPEKKTYTRPEGIFL